MALRFWRMVKNNLFAIITIGISITVLLYFLFTTDGIYALMKMFDELRARWLFAALGAAAGAWLLEGYSLHIICKRLYPRWSYPYSLTVGMVGLLYSAITPFATGGQPMQIYSMKRLGMDTGTAGSIITVKTLVYQIVMVVYALLLVVFKLRYFQTNVTNFSFLIVVGLCANAVFISLVILFAVNEKLTDKLLLASLGFLNRIRLCKKPQERYDKIHRELQLFYDSAKVMGRSVKVYLTSALSTAFQITLNCVIPYFIYRAFNLSEQSIFTMMAAQAFVAMVSAFVPLPGASGGAEGSFYLFFGPFFSLAPGSIVPAILIWRMITYYFNILFGCVFAAVGNRLPAKNLVSGSQKTG